MIKVRMPEELNYSFKSILNGGDHPRHPAALIFTKPSLPLLALPC
jgi:hypothetical protein